MDSGLLATGDPQQLLFSRRPVSPLTRQSLLTELAVLDLPDECHESRPPSLRTAPLIKNSIPVPSSALWHQHVQCGSVVMPLISSFGLANWDDHIARHTS